VYCVGCDRGIHYYAMQYVEGQSLAEVVEQLRISDVGLRIEQPSDRASDPSEIQNPSSKIATQPLAGKDLPAPSPRRGGLGRGNASGAQPVISATSSSGLPSRALLPDTVPLAALLTLRTSSPRERFRHIAQLGIQAAKP
jgi:hypothetical protein